MKANYTLAAIFAAASLSLSAQQIVGFTEVQGQKAAILDITSQVMSQAPMRAADNYVRWGYCDDDIQCKMGGTNSSIEEQKAAILLNRNMLGAYKDARVMGLRIGLSDEAKDVTAFLSEIPATSQLAPEDLAVTPVMSASLSGTTQAGWHEVIFRVPYQFNDNILMAGYSGSGTLFVGYDGGTSYENACYMWFRGRWMTTYNTSVMNRYGSACIQLLLGGDDLPDNDMAIGEILTQHVEQNKPTVIRGEAYNVTATPAHSYEVTCLLGNGKSYSKTIEHIVGSNAVDTFSIEIPAMTKVERVPMQISISKVNGEDDIEPGNNTTMAQIDVIEEGCYFPRMILVEEATSTKCGFCPNGIVIMESMTSRYPDTMIGIAVHTSGMGYDPMIVDEYDMISNKIGSEALPNGIVNRKRALTGMPVYFEKYYDAEKGQLSIAKVEVSASKPSADGKVKISTDVTFNKDMSNGNRYLLSYVLVEDEVKGYTQLNNYHGGYNGQMAGWEKLPEDVDIDFNLVARGVWDLEGLLNSIPRECTKKVPVRHEYEISLPKTIQDPEKCWLVAMLLDQGNDGECIQAAKTYLGASSSGIENVADGIEAKGEFTVAGGMIFHADDAVEVYDLQGRRVVNANLKAGIYIARSGNDTAKIAIR